MRPAVLIKNTDRAGKVAGKWFVKIGKRSREFDEAQWRSEGIAWINEQLA